MAVTLKGQSAIYEGTSADMKPSDADKNAIFQELDTGIDYYYDGTDWNEIPSSGGGGGGTGTDNYNELNNKPSINGTTLSGNKSLDNLGIQAKLTFDSAPTEDSENPVKSGGVYTALATNIQGIKVNGSTVNPDSNKVVSITVPTSAADVSALPDTTKYAAALSLTINSSTFVMTGQLKDQNGDNLGAAQTIDLPLESVVVDGSYNSQTKKVVLTLQNGNTIEFSVADLVSGLQTELSASNKLNPAYINYDSTHRAVSDTEKSTWNGKQNALSSTQLAAVNSGIDSTKVAQIETNKNNILSDNIISTSFTWGNGYISTGGHIFASSQSYFSQPFTLHAGEKIVVRTKNKNICIIGSTTADSVAAGDNISILRTTSDVDQEETYDYTATEDIKIVICVVASNYVAYVSNHNTNLLLGSYATAAIKRLESRVTALENQ